MSCVGRLCCDVERGASQVSDLVLCVCRKPKEGAANGEGAGRVWRVHVCGERRRPGLVAVRVGSVAGRAVVRAARGWVGPWERVCRV